MSEPGRREVLALLLRTQKLPCVPERGCEKEG